LAFKQKIKNLDANFENLTSRIEMELEPEMQKTISEIDLA
jgi:hypothetical protein